MASDKRCANFITPDTDQVIWDGLGPALLAIHCTGTTLPLMLRDHASSAAEDGVATQGGRPSKRSNGLVAEIIDRISRGETLSAICRDDRMPARQKVYEWTKADSALAAAVAVAREQGFEAIAEEALEIADNQAEDPASRRVRIDARLKLLAKWCPKRYGDRLDVGHTGEMGVTVRIGGDAGM